MPTVTLDTWLDWLILAAVGFLLWRLGHVTGRVRAFASLQASMESVAARMVEGGKVVDTAMRQLADVVASLKTGRRDSSSS